MAPEPVHDPAPASALVDCPKPWPRARLAVTGDLLAAANHNEAALRTCNAQVATLRAWDAARRAETAGIQPKGKGAAE